MDDHTAIGTAVSSMLHAIDALDWPRVRSAFTDSVRVDYTSLAGGEPADVPADALIASWQELLPGFDATQHLTGPVLTNISGSRATAETHVRGYHHLKGAAGGDIWMVAGHYTLQLSSGGSGWKIGAIKLTVFYQEGNLKLPEIARQGVKRKV